MKLLTKTGLHIITAFLFIFFVAGVIFFQLFRSSILEKSDEELRNKLKGIRRTVTQTVVNKYTKLDIYNDVKIVHINKVRGTDMNIRDTFFFDHLTKSYIPFRILSENTHIGSDYYRMSVTKSMYESHDLIEKMTLAFTVMAVLFLLTIYLLNRLFFRQIWSDFFDTTEKLRNYDLSKLSKIGLRDSSIKEFAELNNVLYSMIHRIEKDFISLKEFSDDLTHEIQTPLAVIRSKAEMMLQQPDLSAEILAGVEAINQNAAKLFKLNKTLILLTKIENRQFENSTEVDISEICEQHLAHFRELMGMKNIEIKTKTSPFKISANAQLIDILILNLLKNAFTHTSVGGIIHIVSEQGTFLVENSGEPLPLDKAAMFERFVSTSKTGVSLGLGLAIVKKIAAYYGFNIRYEYSGGFHKFTLNL